MATDGMTRREREDLAALVRRREKVSKTGVKERTSQLTAQVEAQLAAIYPEDDPRWKDITAEAQRAAQAADAAVAEKCRALGIPEQFRPGLSLFWHGRGENAMGSRRAELRQLAKRRIDALEKSAYAAIEARSVEVQTQLLAGGLESDAARAFLETMPTAEALMPVVVVEQLEQLANAGRKKPQSLWSGTIDDEP